MADRVTFTSSAARRIANAVLKVEAGDTDGAGLRFKHVASSPGSVFRVCTFTASWSKSTEQTVTFKNQTDTPNTVSALNLFADIGTSASSTRNCAIAREGTAWFLIAAEC